jgi:hypothetical protein
VVAVAGVTVIAGACGGLYWLIPGHRRKPHRRRRQRLAVPGPATELAHSAFGGGLVDGCDVVVDAHCGQPSV